MSKASDVRDAVLAALNEELTDQTVEAFIVPNYTREELANGPRIIARVGGRVLALGQGVDETDVNIEVGVVGVSPRNEDANTPFKDEEIAACDEFDTLMEEVIDLFMDRGELAYCAMAQHRLTGIEQAIQLDPEKFYTDGIWLSVIRLTYRDSED